MNRRRGAHALVATLIAASALAGCGSSGLLPSGSGSAAPVTDSRGVPAFTAVENTTSADLTVQVGAPGPVVVSGAADVVPKITTRVEGDTLTIGTDGAFSTVVPLRVTAPTAALTRLAVRGSGDATIRGATGTLQVDASGSGDVTGIGTLDVLTATASGSGALALGALPAGTAEVTVSGSGDAEVAVVRTLRAVVTGSGDIVYSAGGATPPVVSREVRGSGDVRAR